jgi:hypothetical protein
MGSRIMHYCIALEILRKYDFNKSLFILGNLAPDAYNRTKEGSYASHFRILKDKMKI